MCFNWQCPQPLAAAFQPAPTPSARPLAQGLAAIRIFSECASPAPACVPRTGLMIPVNCGFAAHLLDEFMGDNTKLFAAHRLNSTVVFGETHHRRRLLLATVPVPLRVQQKP